MNRLYIYHRIITIHLCPIHIFICLPSTMSASNKRILSSVWLRTRSIPFLLLLLLLLYSLATLLLLCTAARLNVDQSETLSLLAEGRCANGSQPNGLCGGGNRFVIKSCLQVIYLYCSIMGEIHTHNLTYRHETT